MCASHQLLGFLRIPEPHQCMRQHIELETLVCQMLPERREFLAAISAREVSADVTGFQLDVTALVHPQQAPAVGKVVEADQALRADVIPVGSHAGRFAVPVWLRPICQKIRPAGHSQP